MIRNKCGMMYFCAAMIIAGVADAAPTNSDASQGTSSNAIIIQWGSASNTSPALTDAASNETVTNAPAARTNDTEPRKDPTRVNRFDFVIAPFFPLGELGAGMNTGVQFTAHLRSPFLHLIPIEKAGDVLPFLNDFSLGLSFSFIQGSSKANVLDQIVFAPIFFDIYYTIPFNLELLHFFAYQGIGGSLAAVTVQRPSGTLLRQSFDFCLQTGVGMEFNMLKTVYLKIDIAYFVAFETVVGMGIKAGFGIGYDF